jgi:hypothetical protein
MAKRGKETCRRRCTECRDWFTPAATAAESQRVCSPHCRKRRQRKLARARRTRQVQRYRVEERERQQASRSRRHAEGRAPAPAVESCHAPASLRNRSELHDEMMRFWDSQQSVSRTTFERELPEILRRFERSGETRAGV